MPERRRIASGAAACRDVIKRRMVNDGLEAVSVTCGDQKMYAHLKRRAPAAPAVTADLVMRAIDNMNITTVTSSDRASLEELVEECVLQQLRPPAAPPPADRSADLAARTLVISTKPPPDVEVAAHVHPLTRSHIQETAAVYATNRAAAQQAKRVQDAELRQWKAKAKQTEASVAQHLSQYDPASAARRVCVVSAGTEATVYLRRRTTTRTRKPTARTALPALRQIVRAMSISAGFAGRPTQEAYRWLTHPRTCAQLRAQVEQAFAQLHTSSEHVAVALDRV